MEATVNRPGAWLLLVGVLLLAGCAGSDGGGAGSGTPVVVVTRTVTATVEPAATPASSPSSVTRLASEHGEWVAVAAASYNTLALKRDGTLWSWGLNDYGQLGRGTADVVAGPTPLQVGHRHDWTAVSAGYGDSFALRSDGTLWAWGNNSDFGGNLGLGMGGRVTGPASPSPATDGPRQGSATRTTGRESSPASSTPWRRRRTAACGAGGPTSTAPSVRKAAPVWTSSRPRSAVEGTG